MYSALFPMPGATTTIALAGQDVPTYFAQIQPLLVLLGIPVAIMTLGVLVWAIKSGFEMLTSMLHTRHNQSEIAKDMQERGFLK